MEGTRHLFRASATGPFFVASAAARQAVTLRSQSKRLHEQFALYRII